MTDTYVSKIMDGIINAKEYKDLVPLKKELDNILADFEGAIDGVVFRIETNRGAANYCVNLATKLQNEHDTLCDVYRYVTKLYAQCETKLNKLE